MSIYNLATTDKKTVLNDIVNNEKEICIGYHNNWHEPRKAYFSGLCGRCEYENDL